MTEVLQPSGYGEPFFRLPLEIAYRADFHAIDIDFYRRCESGWTTSAKGHLQFEIDIALHLRREIDVGFMADHTKRVVVETRSQ